MSKYRVHKSVVQSVQAILCAIEDRIVHRLNLGASKAQESEQKFLHLQAKKIIAENITVDLANPVHLEGYHGDTRTETAHIRVPRAIVNRYLGGGASNDVGFTKTADGFDAIVSEYDKNAWWNQAADRFWQAAATHEACEAMTLNGYTVETVEDEDGNIQIYCDSLT